MFGGLVTAGYTGKINKQQFNRIKLFICQFFKVSLTAKDNSNNNKKPKTQDGKK